MLDQIIAAINTIFLLVIVPILYAESFNKCHTKKYDTALKYFAYGAGFLFYYCGVILLKDPAPDTSIMAWIFSSTVISILYYCFIVFIIGFYTMIDLLLTYFTKPQKGL